MMEEEAITKMNANKWVKVWPLPWGFKKRVTEGPEKREINAEI